MFEKNFQVQMYQGTGGLKKFQSSKSSTQGTKSINVQVQSPVQV